MAAANNANNANQAANQAAAANPTIKVLEDEALINHEEDEGEVEEYAEHIGIDIEHDRDLFWIAREGLRAVPPAPWKACQVEGNDEVFYFNFETGESVWDHPSDELYRDLVQQEMEKRVIAPVVLSIEEEAADGSFLFRGHNLAGESLCAARVTSPTTQRVGDVVDAMAAGLQVNEGTVSRFVLPNAKLLAHSQRCKSVHQVLFAQEDADTKES